MPLTQGQMMQCLKPIELPSGFITCGQCRNCRIDKKRVWTCRLLLESKYYPTSSFVTLTYEDDNIPMTVDGLTNLLKEDVKTFIRDFRYSYRSWDANFRYFAVGEYGKDTQRAHFHLILFGVDPERADLIHETWGKGFTTTSEITRARIAYAAQYCLKKLSAPDLEDETRNPEFALQSRKPGIGAPALNYLENVLCSKHGSEYIAYAMDVFKAIRIDGKIYPLGNYLRSILRHRLGIPQSRPERMLHFGCSESFDPEGAVASMYGEEDEKWWEEYAWKSDIMYYQTPARSNASKKIAQEKQPEIIKAAQIAVRKEINRAHRSTKTEVSL